MSTTAPEATFSSIIEEIYEPGLTTSELAEKAIALAPDELNQRVLIQGWANKISGFESNWTLPEEEESAPRSGHDNQSGRFSTTSSLPGRGILDRTIRIKGGPAIRYGDVTKDIALQLSAEYRERKDAEAVGEKFWQNVAAALSDEQTVDALGESKAEALQRQAGYRV